MDDGRAPKHLADPPAPPNEGRPSAVVSQSRPLSSSIEVPRRGTDVPSPRDASLFQELLRGFGEMRERMISAESKVEFLSELLPEIWARMASQEATAQASQRTMTDTTQEARIQAAQASMAAERSQQTVEHLREMLLADEEARRSAGAAAVGAKESAQRAEVLAARLEEQIRALANAHTDMAAIRQEVIDASERSADQARSVMIETQRGVDEALREARGMAETATSAATQLHQETRYATSDAVDRVTRLAQELTEQVDTVGTRIGEEEARRAEQLAWASELEASLAAYAQQAAGASDAAHEQAALMELREQSAAAARENLMKSVESIMRAARETFVASRDAGDEVISQAKTASVEAALATAEAQQAVQQAREHAEQAAASRRSQDESSASAVRAASNAQEAADTAARILDEQKDMTSAARQVALSADEARSSAAQAQELAAGAEKAARAAAGEAQRVATAEVDRLGAFEKSVTDLRAAAAEAIQAAEMTRGLIWQVAHDEMGRDDTVAALSARYDKELRSLEGAVQSARGAARSAQEASRSARQAKKEAEEDATQAAEAAAHAARSMIRVDRPTEDAASRDDIAATADAPDKPAFDLSAESSESETGFWESRERGEEMLLENDQDAMWVERFRRVWSARGKRASEENDQVS